MPLSVFLGLPKPFPFAAALGIPSLFRNVGFDLSGGQFMLPALLGQRNQFFDKRSQFLGLGQRGNNPTGHPGPHRIILVLLKCTNQAARHVPQHGAAVRRAAAEFTASHSMSHRAICVWGRRRPGVGKVYFVSMFVSGR